MPPHIYFSGAKGDDLLTITPVLDTAIYAALDTLFVTIEVPSAARVGGGAVLIKGLYVIDKDDEKPVFDLYIFDRTVTFGTLNEAPSLSDAHAAYYQGHISVATADYKDVGGNSLAKVSPTPFVVKPNATSLFVAAVNLSGTPTFTTASDLVLKLAIERL
jgi:hypothetical protein